MKWWKLESSLRWMRDRRIFPARTFLVDLEFLDLSVLSTSRLICVPLHACTNLDILYFLSDTLCFQSHKHCFIRSPSTRSLSAETTARELPLAWVRTWSQWRNACMISDFQKNSFNCPNDSLMTREWMRWNRRDIFLARCAERTH